MVRPNRTSPDAPAAPRRRQRGFTLVETLVAASVLTIAVLGHAATAVSADRLNQVGAKRGLAMLTLHRFVERMRADDDWAGLYARLLAKSAESATDGTLSSLAADPALPTFAPTSYYPDFVAPASLGTVTVLVQVPATTVAGTRHLLETLVAPRYGLPYDLDGDGIIDAASHDADRRALPIVVRLRWAVPGRPSDEVVVASWLRTDG